MTDYEIKLPKELLSNLMTESTGFAELIGSVLKQVLEAHATELIVMSAAQTVEVTGTA